MIQRIAGALFLLSTGVVLIGLTWGLADNVAVYQDPDGYCELESGEALGRLEDRRNATDSDGDGRPEYIYVRLGRYDVSNELPSGASATATPYTACRLVISPPDPAAPGQEFFADIDADSDSKPAATVVVIYDNAGNVSFQCSTGGQVDTADSDSPCDPDPATDDRTVTYGDYGVSDATLADMPVINARVENASWKEQPDMFDSVTPQGRLISQSVELYGILVFVGVGGIGLSYFFRRRRQG
ncbi:MAG: hypothetical protein J4G14_13735 [Dehalococcoidia bacterium]|nr:hypothetical protein [Dehalococcoidia bacterium]